MAGLEQNIIHWVEKKMGKPALYNTKKEVPSFYHPGNYSTHIYHHVLDSFSSELQPRPIYYKKYFEKWEGGKLNLGTFILRYAAWLFIFYFLCEIVEG